MTDVLRDVDSSKLMILEEMAKVELHVHMDGSIPPQAALDIWQERGQPILLPEKDINGNPILYGNQEDRAIITPEELSAYWGDWHRYSIPDRFGVITKLMQDREGIIRIASEHILNLARRNIIYAETRFAPQYSVNPKNPKSLNMYQVVEYALEGIKQGMERAKAEGKEILAKLIVCIGREAEPDVGIEVARAALEYQDRGVVALDLACFEPPFPPERHENAFKLTFDSGLKRTVHAGEMMAFGLDDHGQADTANMRNIYVAMKMLRADGIGHAIPLHRRIYEGIDLVTLALERGIRIETNPVSNIATNAVTGLQSLDQLNLDKLIRYGLLVSVNSDDPEMWKNGSLAHNLYFLREMYGMSSVQQVLRNAVDSAFGLDAKQKIDYIRRLGV